MGVVCAVQKEKREPDFPPSGLNLSLAFPKNIWDIYEITEK